MTTLNFSLNTNNYAHAHFTGNCGQLRKYCARKILIITRMRTVQETVDSSGNTVLGKSANCRHAKGRTDGFHNN